MRFLIAKHLCNYKEAVLYIGYMFYYKENTKARTESKVNER